MKELNDEGFGVKKVSRTLLIYMSGSKRHFLLVWEKKKKHTLQIDFMCIIQEAVLWLLKQVLDLQTDLSMNSDGLTLCQTHAES